MAAYKVVHAVCSLLCGVQIMDTRHIMLNEWQLLPEEWVLAVASKVGICYEYPSTDIRGRGTGSVTGGLGLYRCKSCDCVFQGLQVFHDDFSSQRTKVFRHAPFHWMERGGWGNREGERKIEKEKGRTVIYQESLSKTVKFIIFPYIGNLTVPRVRQFPRPPLFFLKQKQEKSNHSLNSDCAC